MKRLSVSLLLLLGMSAQTGLSQSIFDSIRATDLNDYALGVAVSTSQSVYKNSDDSTFLYPYLSSGEHPAFHDRSIIATEGNLGWRWVTESKWDVGILGRIETQTLEADNDLRGINERQATIEVGPSVGYRGWPVHFNITNYFGVLDRHGASRTELDISYPIRLNRGYIIPAIDLNWDSDGYNSYYYGITEAESSPLLAAYDSDAGFNTGIKVNMGYQLSERWHLRGRLGFEFLSDEVTDSPLVDPDKDSLWSATLGLQYNADIFGSRNPQWNPDRLPKSEIKLSLFNDHIETDIQDNRSGPISNKVDLEDILGVSDEETVLQVDALFRLANYHRIEFSYLDIDRSGQALIQNDLRISAESFPSGTLVESDINTQTARFTYGYSLLLSSQAELGVKAGVHQTQIEAGFIARETDQFVGSDVSPLLPVLGAYGSISLTRSLLLLAEVQAFAMDFDNYEGALTYLRAELQWNFDHFGVGIGYSYYGMNLDAKKDDLSGKVEFRHQGPAVSMLFRF